MQPTVLITGGAGFIASNVLLHLFERMPEHRFLVLDALTYAGNPHNIPQSIRDSPRFQFWYGNVNNLTLVEELVKQSTAVVHFAAESHVARSIFDNRIFFDTDVLGTQTISNAVLKHKKTVERFLHISSSEVYGTARSEPMGEDHPLVPRFITSCLLEEPMTVHGAGDASRDWLYVADHAAAIERLLTVPIDKVRGQTLNLGTGRAVSVMQIAQIIARAMDRPKASITHISDRPGQVHKHISSTARAESLLGWKATTSLEDGLRRTIEWYRDNRAWWEPLRWMRHVPILTSDGEVEMH
jgi:dTDP-glucose 4,6-dehydratase